jgi:hypothetical protein
MTEEAMRTCNYVREDGSSCPGEIEGEGQLCFWHGPDAAKEGGDVRPRLEEWAASGESLQGFVLCYAHLEGVRLYEQRRGYDLSHANLKNARLQGASLFNLHLRGSDLLKTDFSGANLNQREHYWYTAICRSNSPLWVLPTAQAIAWSRALNLTVS